MTQWLDIQDTFECEELNQVEVPEYGDSIFYMANRSIDTLEKATEEAFRILEEWETETLEGDQDELYS